jgi:hypothetical protein
MPIPIPRPERRPLRIFATDPIAGVTPENCIQIEISNEPLRPGPQGDRVEVVDYDGTRRAFYGAVDLENPGILMRGGLDPSESDPRFHQQMVYAVAMRTVENFDRALGRRLTFRDNRRLRIYPHAFHGANAFYDRKLRAVLFGYFRADDDEPGLNMPGQNIFTCLSHDIITHEITHALVDRLREHFLEPTNLDVLAFHEGFADIVSLLQHFSFRQLLIQAIQQTRGNITERSLLVDMARQFGHGLGTNQALRSALDKPERKLIGRVFEPHDRGAILVAAVFEGFFTTYKRRIKDLVRIATGGTGELPGGDLHPDLVNRIAMEASRTAESVLRMCIRAFEYLPPVDITFGDYLRALVTADFELSPDDEFGMRASVIEGFRQRGIFPSGVASLAEGSLLWPRAEGLAEFPADVLGQLVVDAAAFGFRARQRTESATNESAQRVLSYQGKAAVSLKEYATQNAEALRLDPSRTINVQGFHSVFRVAPHGELLIEHVAQFTQIDDAEDDSLGGLSVRGGTTVVAAADGTVRYVIAKPLPTAKLDAVGRSEAQARIERQRQFVRLSDSIDPTLDFMSASQLRSRMVARAQLSRLHSGGRR